MSESPQVESETSAPKRRKMSLRKRRWLISLYVVSGAVFIANITGGISWVAKHTIARSIYYPPGAETWNMENILESVEIGDGIIAALERFNKEFGHYPNTLKALVPDYLPRVLDPVTYFGWRYEYERDDTSMITSYSLSTMAVIPHFYYFEMEKVEYRSQPRLWIISTVDYSEPNGGWFRESPLPRP